MHPSIKSSIRTRHQRRSQPISRTSEPKSRPVSRFAYNLWTGIYRGWGKSEASFPHERMQYSRFTVPVLTFLVLGCVFSNDFCIYWYLILSALYFYYLTHTLELMHIDDAELMCRQRSSSIDEYNVMAEGRLLVGLRTIYSKSAIAAVWLYLIWELLMARLMSCRTRFNDPDEVLGAAGLLPHPATHIITLQQSMYIYSIGWAYKGKQP